MSVERVACPKCQGFLVVEPDTLVPAIRCVLCGNIIYKPIACLCAHDKANRTISKRNGWER